MIPGQAVRESGAACIAGRAMTTRDPFGQPDENENETPVSERAARGCVRPDEALDAHARGELELSEFERGEISQFPEVWFTGLPGGAKPSPRRDAPGEVSGDGSDAGPFADARLDYAGLAHAGDHLAYRYEIERVVGKGSFAKVVRCFDHKRNERVAVKVVRDAPRFHAQVETELEVLKALGGRRGCVELLDVFAFRGHRCLVFELASMSLREWLTNHAPTATGVTAGDGARDPTARARRVAVGASVGMCRRVAGQLLDALAFLTEKSIIHCDLKLENVLLRSPNASEIVLVDFGSACFANAPGTRKRAYVQSRHCRAPEVLLGAAYDAQIDVWSLGCLLAELHSGRPAFAGRDEMHQLLKIAEVIGAPPERVLRRSDERKRRAWTEMLEKAARGSDAPVFLGRARCATRWTGATTATSWTSSVSASPGLRTSGSRRAARCCTRGPGEWASSTSRARRASRTTAAPGRIRAGTHQGRCPGLFRSRPRATFATRASARGGTRSSGPSRWSCR